jgi:hypothetical protein
LVEATRAREEAARTYNQRLADRAMDKERERRLSEGGPRSPVAESAHRKQQHLLANIKIVGEHQRHKGMADDDPATASAPTMAIADAADEHARATKETTGRGTFTLGSFLSLKGIDLCSICSARR